MSSNIIVLSISCEWVCPKVKTTIEDMKFTILVKALAIWSFFKNLQSIFIQHQQKERRRLLNIICINTIWLCWPCPYTFGRGLPGFITMNSVFCMYCGSKEWYFLKMVKFWTFWSCPRPLCGKSNEINNLCFSYLPWWIIRNSKKKIAL